MTRCERGTVPYGERSQGTRWRMALDEAVRRIRQLGMQREAFIAVPQEAWECLDPDNRRAVHEHACELGVMVMTAEAASGELRAEAFQEN